MRLSDEIEARLKNEARNEGKSQSEIVRLAIVEYLESRTNERFLAEIINTARDRLPMDCFVIIKHLLACDRSRLTDGPLTVLTNDEMVAVDKTLIGFL